MQSTTSDYGTKSTEGRVEKKYPDRPITGKEWIEGYRKWKSNSTPSNYANGCKACKQDIAPEPAPKAYDFSEPMFLAISS